MVDIETKIKEITEIITAKKWTYMEIKNTESVNIIHDLFKNNIIPIITNDTDKDIYLYMAVYHNFQQKYDDMIKYYLMAIDKKCSTSMNNLASHYYDTQNWKDMEKYFLMAIEENHVEAMVHLACYYHQFRDYNNMKKYYSMAIDNKYYWTLELYYNYYRSNTNDCGLYVFNDFHKQGIPHAQKYFLELLKYSDEKATLEFLDHVKTIQLEHDVQKLEIAEMKSYITELELLPEGVKYMETKQHFESISTVKMD
jgi:predicted DNA-binding WGR domain protein